MQRLSQRQIVGGDNEGRERRANIIYALNPLGVAFGFGEGAGQNTSEYKRSRQRQGEPATCFHLHGANYIGGCPLSILCSPGTEIMSKAQNPKSKV